MAPKRIRAKKNSKTTTATDRISCNAYNSDRRIRGGHRKDRHFRRRNMCRGRRAATWWGTDSGFAGMAFFVKNTKNIRSRWEECA